MKKLILSLAFAGTLIMATSACNSSKNMAGSSDTTTVADTVPPPVDTVTKPVDTTKTLPDTTRKM